MGMLQTIFSHYNINKLNYTSYEGCFNIKTKCNSQISGRGETRTIGIW